MKIESPTPSNRQHILEVGYKLIAAKGFSCVGLAQLLQTAEVPKGSFYHYFKSKEQFGEALIQGYFEGYKFDLDSLFGNTSLNGYDRLMTYCTDPRLYRSEVSGGQTQRGSGRSF